MRKFLFVLTILFSGLMAQAQVEVKPTVPVTGTETPAAPPTKAVMTFTDGRCVESTRCIPTARDI